jgi:hypothetical protein
MKSGGGDQYAHAHIAHGGNISKNPANQRHISIFDGVTWAAARKNNAAENMA